MEGCRNSGTERAQGLYSYGSDSTSEDINIRADGNTKGKDSNSFKGRPGLRKKPYWGNHFWSRGYCVTTIGMDEDKIRRYVKYQEDHEKIEEAGAKDYGLFERPDT